MGLNGIDSFCGKTCGHPPKKKWIHCYMSLDENNGAVSGSRSDGDIHDNGSSGARSYGNCHIPASVCGLEAQINTKVLRDKQIEHQFLPDKPVDRQIISVSSFDDRPFRGQHAVHRLLPPNGGRTSPIYGTPSSSLNSSTSPTSSCDSSSPVLGHRMTLEAGSSPESPPKSFTTVESSSFGHLLPLDVQQGRFPLGGFLKTNGFAKLPYANDYKVFDESSSRDRDETKRRSIPSREVHNKLEKNRRAHLKECFDILKRQLPSMEDKKVSNQTILKAAHKYILNLKRKERDYEHEMERLARQKIGFQQRFSSLKRDLQAKWDHIDFSIILPDGTSAELNRDKDTKSTTTASEQPEFEGASDLRRTAWHDAPPSDFGQYTPTNIERLSVSGHRKGDDVYEDSNLPLNLSTNSFGSERSSRVEVVDGDWAQKQSLSYSTSPYLHEDKIHKLGVHPPGSTLQVGRIASKAENSTVLTVSTTTSHISSLCSQPCSSVQATGTTGGVLPISQFIIGSRNLATKFVTTLSSSASDVTVSPAVTNHHQSSHGHTSPSQVYAISHPFPPKLESGAHTIPTTLAIGGVVPSNNLGAISTDSARVSGGTVLAAPNYDQAAIPLVGGRPIPLPTQLLTTGNVLGQPTIQVISPEGYKIVQAEHNQNGAKPLAITLSHPGLDQISANGEDSKSTPLMVTVSKNGLSTLHLTVSTSPRALPTSLVTSVPLNLSVSSPGVVSPKSKSTQSGPGPIIPSYIPFNHANGVAQIVQGMSLVGPLVVSQAQQRSAVSQKGGVLKVTAGAPVPSSPGMPIVPAQYGGNLVNSVVMVSAAPGTMPLPAASTPSAAALGGGAMASLKRK